MDLDDSALTSMQAHAILMALTFGVLLPCIAGIGRYLKEHLDDWWLRAHGSLAAISTLFIVFGLYFVSPGKTGVNWHTNDTHSLLGWSAVAILLIQIGLGIYCATTPASDDKQEPVQDNIHGYIGKILLAIGAINAFMGIHHYQYFDEDFDTTEYYIAYFAWFAIASAIGIYLERHYGRASRYAEGNIFVAAASVGADKLFSMSLAERMKAIKTTGKSHSSDDEATTPPNNDITPNNFAVERRKEGNTSPFMYRPTWDSGLKQQKDIKSIVSVEGYVEKPLEEKKPAYEPDILTRIKNKDNEKTKLRSRTNSIVEVKRTGSASDAIGNRSRTNSVTANASDVNKRQSFISSNLGSPGTSLSRSADPANRSKNMFGFSPSTGVQRSLSPEGELTGSITAAIAKKDKHGDASSPKIVVREDPVGRVREKTNSNSPSSPVRHTRKDDDKEQEVVIQMPKKD